MTIKTTNKAVKLSTLKAGTCFKLNGDTLIATDEIDGSYRKVVGLLNGVIYSIKRNAKVEPRHNAEVVI